MVIICVNCQVKDFLFCMSILRQQLYVNDNSKGVTSPNLFYIQILLNPIVHDNLVDVVTAMHCW